MSPRHVRPSRVMWLLALIAALATTGCSTKAQTEQFNPPLSYSAPATGATLSVDEFKEAIQQPDTIILDVRTDSEFASGHLREAINIDMQGSEFAELVANLDQEKTYALYCNSGSRSQVALDYLTEQGFSHAYHLGEGITGWIAADQPVVS